MKKDGNAPNEKIRSFADCCRVWIADKLFVFLFSGAVGLSLALTGFVANSYSDRISLIEERVTLIQSKFGDKVEELKIGDALRTQYNNQIGADMYSLTQALESQRAHFEQLRGQMGEFPNKHAALEKVLSNLEAELEKQSAQVRLVVAKQDAFLFRVSELEDSMIAMKDAAEELQSQLLNIEDFYGTFSVN